MERKPISLEKNEFDINDETDYFPLHYDNQINICVSEKNEIAPVFDNSDNFWDNYIKIINRIQGALAYISNNYDCISDNPGYIKIADEASDYCSNVIHKIRKNDRSTKGIENEGRHYLEQTETIVKYIEHKINVTSSAVSLQSTAADSGKIRTLLYKIPRSIFFLLILYCITVFFVFLHEVCYFIEGLNEIVDLIFYLLLFLSIILSITIIPYKILKFIIKKIIRHIHDKRSQSSL